MTVDVVSRNLSREALFARKTPRFADCRRAFRVYWSHFGKPPRIRGREEEGVRQTIGINILTLLFWAAGLLWTTGCGSTPPAASDKNSEAAAAPARAVGVATSVSFTEGPTVDNDGNVYFTDTTNSRILKLSPGGERTIFREPSNRANGLVLDAEGRLLACEGSDEQVNQPRVTRTDLATGKIEILADSFEGKRLNQPNDVTFDGQGRIYFSDRPRATPDPDQTGVNAVYRIDPDGSLHRILAEPDIEKPNGIVISPDDKTLYLIEAHPDEGRARMIRAYDLQPDGSVANMRVFHDFYPGRSGDGMTIDSQGNLYVAAGLHNLRGTSETLDTRCGVHVFSPDGQLKEFVPIPEDTVTNCAFGGPDWKTLYVTAGKTLFQIRFDIEGTRR
jgi:gluconolactonase